MWCCVQAVNATENPAEGGLGRVPSIPTGGTHRGPRVGDGAAHSGLNINLRIIRGPTWSGVRLESQARSPIQRAKEIKKEFSFTFIFLKLIQCVS